MARISLWKPQRGNDFKFFDRHILGLFTMGALGVNVHKLLGPKVDAKASDDATQPTITNLSEQAIQDLLFLENRDRKYEPDVYELRGHYNVGDTDFSLSQFGLFIQNDTVFVTFHINDMVDRIGRKLMAGDVLELPNLRDYFPLDETIPAALKKFYVVDEASRAADGFSPTWYPHLWRCKCVPMVNSQEFKDILDNEEKELQATKGGAAFSITDLLSTYNQALQIEDAIIDEAKANVPRSGYDTTPFFVMPTNDDGSPAQAHTFLCDDFETTVDTANTITCDFTVVTPKRNMQGYLTGDENAPNGWECPALTYFPDNASAGQYCLRVDYRPNAVFRYDGRRWVRVNDVQRVELGSGNENTLLGSFVNNNNSTDS